MKTKYLIGGIILILALAFYLMVSVKSPRNTVASGENGTRFVDTISKIPTPENKNRIQKMLDETSYALIAVAIDDPSHINTVLSSLSSDEFVLIEVTRSVSAFSGNATQEAITKLQNNPYVGDIYATGRTTTS